MTEALASAASTGTQDPSPPHVRVVVVGMGSEWRRDDGVGIAVATRFAERCPRDLLANCHVVAPLTGPLDLLGQWDGADLAVVVDATSSNLSTGAVSRIELEGPPGPIPAATGVDDIASDSEKEHALVGLGLSSSHGIGLTGAFRLARAVGRAPARVVVIGIEGDDFGQGSGMSPLVAGAVDEAAVAVVKLVEEAFACA